MSSFPPEPQPDLLDSIWDFIEQRVAAFEAAWSRGERPRIGDYLPENDATEGQLLVELAHTELELRLRAGETATAADYIAAWPRLDSPGTASGLFAVERKWRKRHEQVRANSVENLLPGKPNQIGRFKVERVIGQGGFGVVYLATDPMLGRQVAIKVPQPHILAKAELRERFVREALVVASLDHPNIVPLYEVGEFGEGSFLVTSYCQGSDLAKWISAQSGPIPIRLAAELIALLAEAMQYCHERGVIHRDLKPANVMLDPNDDRDGLPFIPRLTDFGVAKVVEMSLAESRSSIVVGTPFYMAPEQIHAQDAIGPEADIYSLGVILYELLCGKPPIEGSLISILIKVREEPPRPPKRLRADLPRDLETICLKCLRKDPRQRYETIGDLAADLRNFLNGRPILARPRTYFERFADWCQPVDRLRDAGMMAIVVNILVILWMVVNHARTFMGTLSLPEAIHPIEPAIVSLCIIVTMHIPMLVIGVATLHGRRSAVYFGELISLILVISAAAVGMELVPAFGHLYDDGDLRSMVFMALFLIFTTQLLAYTIACMSLMLHPIRSMRNASAQSNSSK